MQFFQSVIDVGKRPVVPLAEDGFNVFLQNVEEIVLVAERSVDGFDQHLLKPALRHGAVVARHISGGRFQPADTPPDNRLFAPIVPVNSAVKFSAFTAVDDVRQAVAAAEHPLFPVRAFMNQPPAHQLLLCLHEYLTRNNGFVGVFFLCKYFFERFDMQDLSPQMIEKAPFNDYVGKSLKGVKFIYL